jgi:hypothetical protein
MAEGSMPALYQSAGDQIFKASDRRYLSLQVHAPAVQDCPAGQAVPHWPQLFGSD